MRKWEGVKVRKCERLGVSPSHFLTVSLSLFSREQNDEI